MPPPMHHHRRGLRRPIECTNRPARLLYTPPGQMTRGVFREKKTETTLLKGGKGAPPSFWEIFFSLGRGRPGGGAPRWIPFEDYRKALEGAGPKLKELILDRAAHDPGIDLMELKELVSSAYPEDV